MNSEQIINGSHLWWWRRLRETWQYHICFLETESCDGVSDFPLTRRELLQQDWAENPRRIQTLFRRCLWSVNLYKIFSTFPANHSSVGGLRKHQLSSLISRGRRKMNGNVKSNFLILLSPSSRLPGPRAPDPGCCWGGWWARWPGWRDPARCGQTQVRTAGTNHSHQLPPGRGGRSQ